jgi:hypothetical protein
MRLVARLPFGEDPDRATGAQVGEAGGERIDVPARLRSVTARVLGAMDGDRSARASRGRRGRIRKSEAIATKRTGRETVASRRAGSTKPP